MAQTGPGDAIALTKNSRYKPDGRKAYLKAMRKWKFDPPYSPATLVPVDLHGSEDSLVFMDHRFKMMMARTEDGHPLGEVAAESTDEDVYYLSPVYIGEGDKKQMVMLDFDTGSADLWGTIPVRTLQIQLANKPSVHEESTWQQSGSYSSLLRSY